MKFDLLTFNHVLSASINLLWLVIVTLILWNKKVLYEVFCNKDTNQLSSHKLLGGVFAVGCITMFSLGLNTEGASLLSACLGMFGLKKFEKPIMDKEKDGKKEAPPSQPSKDGDKE